MGKAVITAAEAVIPNQGITVPAFIVALSMGLAAYCGGGT